MDVVQRFVPPAELSGGRVETVEVPVIGADQHGAVGHDRGRFDLAFGLVGPSLFSGRGIDGMNDTPEVTHIDEPLAHGR